jgi:transcriptional regulator with XRE-family HTH domain
MVGTDEATEDRRYSHSLGERLRSVRQQQGLSLQDVEARSGGELKASVVGAYERGERSVSITRLRVLAEFFRVPVAELMPDPAPQQAPPTLAEGGDQLVIDLLALEARRDEEPVLARYVESIRGRRGDFNGRVLSVRSSDLVTLAAVLDADPGELHERLIDAGIVRTVARRER